MLQSVLEEFDLLSDCNETPLGNDGGFSGSEIWKIESRNRGCFCLKRWPIQFQDESRIQWIHKILVFSQANGCPEIVAPLPTRSGKTYVFSNGTYWELSTWADGEICASDKINQQRIESAIHWLARFHQATARYFFNFSPSKKIVDVRNRLLNLQTEIQTIEQHRGHHQVLPDEDWLIFKQRAPAIATDIARFLLPFSSQMYPVQPVVRDIRPDHLFFDGEQVSAVIDFAAMQIDTVACDLSRLLGGFFEDDARQFSGAIDTYAQHRAVHVFEREVILPLNHASVILGIANWLRWLVIDKKHFDSAAEVSNRLQNLFRRFHSFSN